MLDDKDIEEFRAIWRSVFAEEISRQEAYDRASEVIRLFELILQMSAII